MDEYGKAGWAGADLVATSALRRLRIYAVNEDCVRLVWHLDVDDDDTTYAADVVSTLINKPARTA